MEKGSILRWNQQNGKQFMSNRLWKRRAVRRRGVGRQIPPSYERISLGKIYNGIGSP